jgi:hypothetical protein
MIRAKCFKLNDDGKVTRGISRQHFEALYIKFQTSSWTSMSKEWDTKVEYCVKPSEGKDIYISYVNDPFDVKCYAKEWVVPPKNLRCKTSGNEELVVALSRKISTDTKPPDVKNRYKYINIRKMRQFIRNSSSVKNVSWVYTFAVEWSACCLGDAYKAAPNYVLTLELDLSATVHEDTSFLIWIEENMMAKVKEMCFCEKFELANETLIRADVQDSDSEAEIQAGEQMENGEGQLIHEDNAASDNEYMF